MAINIRIYSVEYMKYPETVYTMITLLEEKIKKSFFDSKILNSISCEEFIGYLIDGKFIEEEFLEYIKEEYGEPWCSTYPVDMETILEALCNWTSMDEDSILKYLKVWYSHIAMKDVEWKKIVYNNFKYKFGDNPEVDIEPIPKEYRNFELSKNFSPAKLELKEDTYNQIIENCEAAIALSDDELVISQLTNILNNIKKE